MTLAVEQFDEGSGSFNDVLLTLPGAPTEGNLILAFCKFYIGGGINTTDWTVLTQFTSEEPQCHIVYRYVESGDTAALPEISATNGGFWRAIAVEISGVTGDPMVDFQDFSLRHEASGGATNHDEAVTPTLSTEELNQISIACVFNTSNASEVLSVDPADYTDLINEDSTTDVTTSSMIWCAYKIIATNSAAPIEVNVTDGAGSQHFYIMQVLIRSGEPAVEPNPLDQRTSTIALSSIYTETPPALTSEVALSTMYTETPPARSSQVALSTLYRDDVPARSSFVSLSVLRSTAEKIRKGASGRSRRYLLPNDEVEAIIGDPPPEVPT